MNGYTFPLEIIDGDLAMDSDAGEVLQSEILSLLRTRKKERILRQNYGTPNFLLKKLDLAAILSELNQALSINVAGLGYASVSVEIESELSDLQQGIINLLISYSLGEELLQSTLLVDLNIDES
jgi:hypothetical protein